MNDYIAKQIKNARRVSTPLCVIRTADPAGTIAALCATKIPAITATGTNGKGNAPLLVWDIINGLVALERPVDTAEPSKNALAQVLGGIDPSSTNNLPECLRQLQRAPSNTICFVQNAHRYMDDASIVQAIWNLRDTFKSNYRMLIMLCPSMTLPAELQQDVLVLDEPLPDDKVLGEIAQLLYKEVQLPAPDEPTLAKIVDATLGLAAYPAEQAMAMSLTEDGIDLVGLWERKRTVIDATPGLSVYRGKEKFADLGGVENFKAFGAKIIAGKKAPRAVIFFDEIEKAIGTGNDTSGTSQDILGQLLTWMTENEATGIILVGPPGACKSALAKSLGNEAGIPTIAFDLGGTKASLVGASEARLRTALKVIDAISQKRALFIATCNSLAILPPELKRRFTFGVFYADLPTSEERAKIWDIYRAKYEVPADYETPYDNDWTGAEIKQCADLSWRLGVPLTDAAKFIVPVAMADADRIEKLRTQADGKFISASYPGVYRYNKLQTEALPTGRRIATTGE